MDKKPIPQHKRVAMGDTIKGYAKGGRVGMPDAKVSGSAKNPLTAARRGNGVKGMKDGGKC